MSTAAARWPHLLWLSVLVLVALLGVARLSTVRLDDDNLWLAYAAMPASGEARAIEHEVHARVAALPGCVEPAFRLGLRERYAANYAGYLATNTAIHRAALASGASATDAIAGTMLATKAILFALLLGILIWVCARTRDANLNAALAFALVALAAADLVAGSGLVPVYSIIDVGKPVQAAVRLGYSVLIASDANSIFGLTPRNAALALFAAAMVLRWRGKPFAAAVAVLLMGAAHQTYGGIGLFLFAATTAVARPAALSGWPARIVLVLAALASVARDRYFGSDSVPLLPMAGVAVLAAGGFALAGSRFYEALRARILGRFADRQIAIDIGVLVLGCAAITVVALVGGARADPVSRMYLWSDLAIRIWSFARFPLAVGAGLLLLPRLRLPGQPALAGIAVLLTLIALTQVDWSGGTRRGAELTAALASPPGESLRFRRDEAHLYGHLGRIAGRAESPALLRGELTAPLGCDPGR